MSNQSYCEKHKSGLSHLEPIIEDLPFNQGGAGRHKCPYCAYEEAYKKGKEHGNPNDGAQVSLPVEEELIFAIIRAYIAPNLKGTDELYELLNNADKILTKALGKSLSEWRKEQKAISNNQE